MASFRFASLLTLLILMFSGAASADVGTRQPQLHERSMLLERSKQLSGDTSANAQRRADSLHAAIIALDGRIFLSYEETLARIAEQQRRRATNDRALTVFALMCCLLALSSSLALWLAHQHFKREKDSVLSALLHQLVLDLMLRVSPEKAGSPTITRVSPVVIIGVVGMTLSVVFYLISRLL